MGATETLSAAGIPLMASSQWPTSGAVTLCTVSPAQTCEYPGCTEPVSCINCHTIQADGEPVVLHHIVTQLCREHAAQQEEALRSCYRLAPARVIHR